MRYSSLFLLMLIVSLEAGGIIGSPQVSVNSQGTYLIDIQLSDFPSIVEEDIAIYGFKSQDLLPAGTFAYRVFETLGEYQRLTLALPGSFSGESFSFRLTVDASLSKDMFIFLPTNKAIDNFSQGISLKLPAKKINKQLQGSSILNELADSSVAEVNNLIPPDNAPQNLIAETSDLLESKASLGPAIIEAEKIETMWAVAQSADVNYEASIYQIMWAFYLENPKAFINENINLVRSDLDLNFPSDELVESTSDAVARRSIRDMITEHEINLLIPGPKLTLTAPKGATIQDENLNSDTAQLLEQNAINLFGLQNNSALTRPGAIKEKSSVLEIGSSQDNRDSSPTLTAKRTFQLNDLIWVGMLSLLLGFITAFILIRLNSKRSTKPD